MEHREYFDSMESFLAFIAKHSGIGSASRVKGESSFRGTSSFEEAVKLAVEGWPEGTARLEEYTAQFTESLGSLLQIDEYFYDVTGQDFDLDRVLIGEPEAWLQTEQVQVKAPALQTLKLVVNIGASGGVEKESIMVRGSAIAALVGLLERSRRRVEVEIVTRVAVKPQWDDATNWDAPCNIGTCRILVKKAGDDLDLSKLAFVLAHPSMLRRLGAAVKENYPKQIAREIVRENYGYSLDVPPDERGDIYTGRMFGSSSVWPKEKAKEWILEELKKQGVELR